MQTPILVFGTALVAVVLTIAAHSTWWRRLPLPPGPPSLPFIGNLFNFPTVNPWLTFVSWGQKYGPIMSARLLGQTFIIINDIDLAYSLFSQDSGTYANRPNSVMLELANMDRVVATRPFGQEHKKGRQIISSVMRSQTFKKFHPTIDYHAIRLLKRLAKQKPGDLTTLKTLLGCVPEHVFHQYAYKRIASVSGEMLIHLSYGYIVGEDSGEQDIAIGQAKKARAFDNFGVLTRPGKFIVELLPFLRHLPLWMPGAEFKRFAASCAETVNQAKKGPLIWAEKQIKAGTARESFARDILGTRREDLTAIEEEDLEWTLFSLFAAGIESLSILVASYCLVACIYPEVQERLQAEIGSVVGKERFPSFDDRPNLPYLNAVCKETLRWLPLAPLALPHCASQDSVYEGYFIPKGSVILTNTWFMGPEPERESWKDAFGFGRRACAGSIVADAFIFIGIAKIAAAFTITKSVGKDGSVLEPNVETKFSGVLASLQPFPCTIEPRAGFAEKLADAFASCPFTGENDTLDAEL
ncbi:cytochrome P450 [Vararia minispora EC-137]|uniref:Cytochrome P450 n=1 Tax=Vararia minispora EC-137 TaxID=1314806 RepID=A0ACB8QWV7_9AGAM|nr:cytochrome P450 [Vararia minispora EC-137]